MVTWPENARRVVSIKFGFSFFGGAIRWPNGDTNCLFMCAKKWNRTPKRNALPQTLGQMLICDCAVHSPIIAGQPESISHTRTFNWLDGIETVSSFFCVCMFFYSPYSSVVRRLVCFALPFFLRSFTRQQFPTQHFSIFAKRLHIIPPELNERRLFLPKQIMWSWTQWYGKNTFRTTRCSLAAALCNM